MDFEINEVFAEVGKLYLTVTKLTTELTATKAALYEAMSEPATDKDEDPEA